MTILQWERALLKPTEGTHLYKNLANLLNLEDKLTINYSFSVVQHEKTGEQFIFQEYRTDLHKSSYLNIQQAYDLLKSHRELTEKGRI